MKARGLSIIAITLLVFQMLGVNSGMDSVSQAATDHDSTKVEVKSKGVKDDILTWEIDVKVAGEEETAETNITFSAGQSHEAINYEEKVSDKETEAGYILQMPTDGKTYTIEIKTKVTDESQAKFKLSAETETDGNIYKDEAEVEVEFKQEEGEDANQDDSNGKESEETSGKESSNEESSEEQKDNETNKVNDAGNQNDTNVNHNEGDVVENEKELSDLEQTLGQSSFTSARNPIALSGGRSSDVWPNPGSLNLDKNANSTNDFLEWEVELNVEGKDLKTSSDIVLLLDKSGSMSGERMRTAKNAAVQFVDTLLKPNSNVRIALVEFSTTTNSNSTFYTSVNKEALIGKINAIYPAGGTHIQAGLHHAETLLASTNADQKTIVLLSDGEPNFSYKASNATPYSWQGLSYQRYLSDFNYSTTIGNGSYNLGSHTYTIEGYPVTTNGLPTISEAKKIIDNGIDIYSVGLAVTNLAENILINSQNKGYKKAGIDNLAPVFEEIAADLKYAATNAKVTDPLGDLFDLVKDGSYNGANFEASHGTVSWDEHSETFTWDIGNVRENEVYTLKYKVTLDCSKKPKIGIEYPTNKTTTLSYKNHNGNQTTKDFPIPKVKVDTGKITKLGYRVNVDGEPVDSNGNLVGSPAEAEHFYTAVFGENLQINQTYSVPAGETPEEYQLYVGTDPTSVTLSSEVCKVVGFGYVKISEMPAGKVTAEYVDEDGNEVAGPEEFEGHIGERYVTVQKNVPGYEFVKMHEDSANPTGTFTAEEQTVIYVYKQLKGTIKVVKVDDADRNKKLEGAKFTIKNDENKKVGELVTDDHGEAVSESLPIGVYTLDEVEAPYGYELSTGQDLSVTVTADGEALITVTNKQLKGTITIIKVDAEDHTILLQNAEFALKDSDGNTIATGITKANGEFMFKNIPVGNYQLEETKAPENYRLLKKPIDVEITPDELQVTKTIENSQKGWEIPKTGGVGTLGFYGVGFILMAIAGWYVFRRRH